MNMFSQGIDPMLDISDINELRRVAEHCNQLPVHPRHPYVGDSRLHRVLGFASRRDQEGLRRARQARRRPVRGALHPDRPARCRPSYEDVVRVNSQSGKGGVAYLLKSENQMDLPRRMQIEFTRSIQEITEDTGKEITGRQIYNEFASEYLDLDSPYLLHGYEAAQNAGGDDRTFSRLA